MARTRLTITRHDLATAAERADLAPGAAETLWSALTAGATRPRFEASHVAFYAGALVTIAALTFYLTESWDTTSGVAKTIFALACAAVFAATSVVLHRHGARIPSGLLATVAVCTTPLAVYGVEQALHVWPQSSPGTYSSFYEYVRGSWIGMELATIAVGLLVLTRVRFPFLVLPIAFASWYLSMDLTPIVFHVHADFTWDERATVSSVVGLVMIAAAIVVDRRTREDYAFWLYLFGSTSFWFGLWAHFDGATAVGEFTTFVIAVAFVVASLVLGRRVFAVYGALGVTGYLGWLSWQFSGSLGFPVALAGCGLAVIGLGIAYQRNETRLETAARALVPATVRRWIPASRV